MSARKAATLSKGEVVSLRPALLRDRDAAIYLGRSASWIRAQRAADVKAIREGQNADGPPWIVIGASVFYRTDSLDKWIEERSIDRGVVPFSNRGQAGES